MKKLPHISHITKAQLYEIAKKHEGMVLCEECRHHDTHRCPAYDTPMKRTSLRIRFCNCGEFLQSDQT